MGRSMLTASQQLLRAKAEQALDRLAKAKSRGNPVEIAQARLGVTRVQAELQQNSAASGTGALSAMRGALARSLTL